MKSTAVFALALPPFAAAITCKITATSTVGCKRWPAVAAKDVTTFQPNATPHFICWGNADAAGTNNTLWAYHDAGACWIWTNGTDPTCNFKVLGECGACKQ